MTVSRVRTWAGAGAVVAAVLVGGSALSACSSNSSSTSSTTKGPTTTGASPTTRASTTTSPGAPTTSTAAGPAQCATSALTGSVVGSSGAAGTIESTVALKYTGSASCTLAGYPGMQMIAASGASLPTVVVRKGTYPFTAMAPATVALGPGQSAYFNVGYSDVPTGSETSCPTSASVQVTPPNAFDHLVMTAAFGACNGGTLVVSPVFLSTGANSQTTAPPSS
jgi:hypothetical protein